MQDKALSVSQLNNYLKSLIENDVILSSIFVKGEISNFKQYGFGGQWYFTLKDEQAQINCVVFNNYIEKIKFVPKDGDAVIVKGRVTVFNKRGTYNLHVFWMEPEGLGALAKTFEQLKTKLEKEGLFVAERKKELPRYPKKVAILAALEGAAVRDVITVGQRRDNTVEFGVLPTIVQGTAAVASIVKNIELLQGSDYEVLILARGGGSLEDLWAFNEEEVARAIAGSNIPIVSAVGHEVDFTIADFVADLRAATPSVAAELVILRGFNI
jgi:exodeoxyribonuclease VII large subunit